MGALFDQLLAWVALHPVWAGLIVFLVAMAESLAIVGVIVPGVAMMFGIGALIAAVTSKSFKWQPLPDLWQQRFGTTSSGKRALFAFAGGAIAMYGARLAGG